MDLNPSPEQKMLRDAAQKYLRAEYGFDARGKAMASPGGRDPAHWARFAEFGWLGLGLPEANGGFGGMAEVVQVSEALGAALAVEPYLPAVVLAGQAVAAAGSAAQRQALLAPLVEGRRILALASTEADSGPSLAWVETRARREGDGWVLDGRKTGVAALPWADAVVVSARTAAAPGARQGIGLFVVPANAAGVTVAPYARYDGMRAGELRLDAVRVGADALLGEASTRSSARWTWPRSRPAPTQSARWRRCCTRRPPTCPRGGSSTRRWPASRCCSTGWWTCSPRSRRRARWS